MAFRSIDHSVQNTVFSWCSLNREFWIPALLLSSWVIWSKLFNLSETWFPNSYKRSKNTPISLNFSRNTEYSFWNFFLHLWIKFSRRYSSALTVCICKKIQKLYYKCKIIAYNMTIISFFIFNRLRFWWVHICSQYRKQQCLYEKGRTPHKNFDKGYLAKNEIVVSTISY